MKHGYLSIIVISSVASVAGCAMDTSQSSEGDNSVQSASTSCTALSSTQSSQREAASVALQLMRLAAPETSGFNQQAAWSILASQRYRVQSSGTGIEFDPTDNFYTGGYVTSAMQAVLSLPQDADPAFAQFLSDGLKAAFANTNGAIYPAFRSIAALNNYKGPGSVSVIVPDSTTNGYPNAHKVTLSTVAQPCGAQVFNFAETVIDSWQYAPLFGDSINDQWRSAPPAAFKGKSALPTMPFNGPSGNPYLVVSINGSPVDWTKASSFSGESCYNFPNNTCFGSLQLDPAPYSEPGAQYDTNSNMMGTQANPFPIDSNLLLADSTHATQWATRSVGGVQQWGTFATPISRGGVTYYSYVKQY